MDVKKLIEFIAPKDFKGKEVDWVISEHTQAIVSVYALYAGYTESKIVDKFLKDLI